MRASSPPRDWRVRSQGAEAPGPAMCDASRFSSSLSPGKCPAPYARPSLRNGHRKMTGCSIYGMCVARKIMSRFGGKRLTCGAYVDGRSAKSMGPSRFVTDIVARCSSLAQLTPEILLDQRQYGGSQQSEAFALISSICQLDPLKRERVAMALKAAPDVELF